MKLNLTQITTLLMCILLMIVSIRGCQQKRKLRGMLTTANNTIAEEKLKNVDARNLIIEHSALTTSIEKELKATKASIKTIKKAYNKQKEELGKITSDSLYILLKGRRELVGKLYDVDSSILVEVEFNKLSLKECGRISYQLQTENNLLKEAVGEYQTVGLKNLELLDQCEVDRIELQRIIDDEKLDKQKFKDKMWNNRSIAGAAVVALVLIIAL